MSNLDVLTMLFVLAEEVHGQTLPVSVYHQAVAQLQDEIGDEVRELGVLQRFSRSKHTLTPYFPELEQIFASQWAAGIHLFRLSMGGAREHITIDPEWARRLLESYEEGSAFPERKMILEPLARRLAAIVQEIAQQGDQ